MKTITITIDGTTFIAEEGTSVLQAVQKAGFYIPTLCSHPDLPTAGACKLCIVEIDGQSELVTACDTIATDGMSINTKSVSVRTLRQDRLASILAHHPHACLTCAQRMGCSRAECSNNVPVPERCCIKFGNCEVRKVADYVGIKADTPRYVYDALPVRTNEALIRLDPNLCIGCVRCVRVCEDVRGIGAIATVDIGGRKVVDVKNGTLVDSACRFCTACVEVCPTGALLDKTQRMGTSLARHEAEVVPCRATCPAGIDIPQYLRFIAEDKFAEATAIVREKVPFPEVLGSICFHPCESVCRRGEVDEPIAICSLKRFAAENDDNLWKEKSRVAVPTGKKVAIIGSGPAGLTAAYYLVKKGHSVTVFEALPEAGGMMRVGIPAFRLPRAVLDKEIEEIARVGVEIRTNSPVGGAKPIQMLKDQGFQAVLLAAGAHKPRKLDVPGETLAGVIDCVSFLRAVSLGQLTGTGEKVVVVGGGSSAIDAARTALRLGAKEISICYRRTREEMSASNVEIADALDEGIHIEPMVSPIRVLGSGKVTGIEFLRMRLIGRDPDGRRHSEPIVGSQFAVDADTVITAIGQEADLAPFEAAGPRVEHGAIKVDETTMTDLDGVFAAGDAVKNPGSVIEAIAAGRHSATAIDKFLGGDGEIDETLVDRGQPNWQLEREDNFGGRARATMPSRDAATRARSFARVELGYDAQMAVAEAKRCLQCDLRLLISEPILPPESRLLEFNRQVVCSIPAGAEGVYQLLDEDKTVLKIKGTASLQRDLEEQLDSNARARYFLWEEDRMYTKRESELISLYVQEHGKMPPGDDELDDLF